MSHIKAKRNMSKPKTIDAFFKTIYGGTCYLLSEKIKIKFLFEEVWNYIHKKWISYKVNLICIRILIVNHTQSYGGYLIYEYLFYYNSFLVLIY